MYDPGSYGDWYEARYAVEGCIDGLVCFGASDLQGDPKAWASNGGLAPTIVLRDNPVLIGSATWRGRLVGLTPHDQVVAGAARLGIDLATLNGDLDFTGMEYWAPNYSGPIGSGNTWGDGDLTYGVKVDGLTFVQDGTGDSGIVTGLFAGSSHEYMAGVLERDDLAAGFGGKR